MQDMDPDSNVDIGQWLQEGKLVKLKPQGISMQPFIRGGVDSVVVCKADSLHVGDIALARHHDKFILHRVVRIKDGKVVLMGDGNLQGVETVDRAEVLGVVTQIIKPDGKSRKPSRGRLWRWLLPVRKYLLKINRKWNKTIKQETI